jgi:hypothetical protein
MERLARKKHVSLFDVIVGDEKNVLYRRREVVNNYEPVVFGKPKVVSQLSSPVMMGSPQLPKRQARFLLL